MTARRLARAIVVLGLLVATVALARPGGGHSYSGGGGGHSSGGGSYSSHSSGGGSGDAGDIGLIVAIFIVWLIVAGIGKLNKDLRFDSTPAARPPPPNPFAVSVAQMHEVDPDFSIAVFEDFAYQLYAAAQGARADAARLAALAPYLSPYASANLAARGGAVAHVAIGSLAIEGTQRLTDVLVLGVRIEANHVLDANQTRFVIEHWQFRRAIGVRTQAPERTRTWPCPQCGAPWAARLGDPFVCDHCGAAVSAGKFDWAVDQIWIESEEAVGPTLTGTVEEVGTDLPTIMHPESAALWAAIGADPGVTWESFTARIAMIYARLNDAWNARELAPARGLATGAMLDYLTYWTTQYLREGLTNHLDAATVSNIVLAKVRRDTYFDAVTVRIFASGLDYTTDAKGKVVGGSNKHPRAYSEYWTFLRSSTRRGPIVTTPACPNCGAPLAIADTGACTHCAAIVDNGSFDWVLSKIEQDEAYRG